MTVAVEFNVDALDISERSQIDLAHFSQDGIVAPGDYILDVQVNENSLSQMKVSFYDMGKGGRACIAPELVEKMGLTEEARGRIGRWHDGTCADLEALSGTLISNEIGEGILRITIPQIWLRYSDPNWVPPEQWDHGVTGVLLDYNLNAQFYDGQGTTRQSLSSYGTLGMNHEAWRLRGDYQFSRYWGEEERQDFEFNRIYAYRPLTTLAAKLTVGEQDLNSQLFDGFRYTGVDVTSDERMLPPKLQGYAPEVSGVAKTNAKVTISQGGRVIYETNVPAGPFRIQDLDRSIRGRLDVQIEEQDGTTSSFQVDTATIPYLTRPGYVRYKLSAGATASVSGDNPHTLDGPAFMAGDFSWGVSNSWSLFGGALTAGDYNSWGLGVGRDLYALGALSADVTQSIARLPGMSTEVGHSFRLNYAKDFDEYNSAITFAGYRFSQKNFMNMSQFLSNKAWLEGKTSDDTNDRVVDIRSDKELYTITANKTFFADEPEHVVTLYFDYNHRTYWDSSAEKRYGLTLNKGLSLGEFKDIQLYLSAYKNESSGEDDQGVSLSLQMPFGERAQVSYSIQSNNSGSTHMAAYRDYTEEGDSYQLGVGMQSDGHKVTKGNYERKGTSANLLLNAYRVQDQYTAVGASLRGGVTATAHGAALHASSGQRGGTRRMVDTGEIADISFNGGRAVTNRFGIAVVGDASQYRKSDIRVDADALPMDVDGQDLIQQGTLTEGAIGYSQFELVSGAKMLASIRQADGSFPPFGASVVRASGQPVSVMDEEGLVYLVGVTPGEQLTVSWGKRQCHLVTPVAKEDLAIQSLTCQA